MGYENRTRGHKRGRRHKKGQKWEKTIFGRDRQFSVDKPDKGYITKGSWKSVRSRETRGIRSTLKANVQHIKFRDFQTGTMKDRYTETCFVE